MGTARGEHDTLPIGAPVQTKGIVVAKQNRTVNSKYSMICGGHTEALIDDLFSQASNPYPPVFDNTNKGASKKYGKLSKQENEKNWVTDEPDVFCNHNIHNKLETNANSVFRKFFRWSVTYDCSELEEIISKKLGKNIGCLYEIIPISRGISGRIKELEILASNTNLVLSEEKKICQVLCHDRLPSTCFIVESRMDDEGFPISFTFRGAGFGDGIGLCISGARSMAQNGADFHAILNHYYRRAQVKRIYEE